MIWKVLAVIWTLLIAVGSMMPAKAVSMSSFIKIPYFDKVLHLCAYVGFVILWSLRFNTKNDTSRKKREVLIGAIFFGILIEISQKYFSVGRQFEFMDIIANISGSILGLSFFNNFLKK